MKSPEALAELAAAVTREWNYFTFVSLVNASSLTATQRAVLRQMAFEVRRDRPHLDDTPHETLAADLGVTSRTVLRARQELLELGVLRVARERPGWSTVYRLCPDRIPLRTRAEIRDRRRGEPEPLTHDQGSEDDTPEPLTHDQGSGGAPLIQDHTTPDRGSHTPRYRDRSDPPPLPPAPRGELDPRVAAKVRQAAEVTEDRRRRDRQQEEQQAARHEWLVGAMLRDLEDLIDRGLAGLADRTIQSWAAAEQRSVQVWFAATRSGAGRGRAIARRLGIPWASIEAIRDHIDHKRMPMPPPTELGVAGALRDAAERWRSSPPPTLGELPADRQARGLDPPPLDDLDAILA
ncbi:MAG: hypothetical protein ABMA64_37765, partial [Myxococcota bacterium]